MDRFVWGRGRFLVLKCEPELIELIQWFGIAQLLVAIREGLAHAMFAPPSLPDPMHESGARCHGWSATPEILQLLQTRKRRLSRFPVPVPDMRRLDILLDDKGLVSQPFEPLSPRRLLLLLS